MKSINGYSTSVVTSADGEEVILNLVGEPGNRFAFSYSPKGLAQLIDLLIEAEEKAKLRRTGEPTRWREMVRGS